MGVTSVCLLRRSLVILGFCACYLYFAPDMIIIRDPSVYSLLTTVHLLSIYICRFLYLKPSPGPLPL